MKGAAVVSAALALGACTSVMPWGESFWRPGAAAGKLEMSTVCNLGGARHLRMSPGSGVLASTAAESAGDVLVIDFSFDLNSAYATFSSDIVSITMGDRTPEARLLSKDDPSGSRHYEVRVPTAGATIVSAQFPIVVTERSTIAVPRVSYRRISRLVLKC